MPCRLGEKSVDFYGAVDFYGVVVSFDSPTFLSSILLWEL